MMQYHMTHLDVVAIESVLSNMMASVQTEFPLEALFLSLNFPDLLSSFLDNFLQPWRLNYHSGIDVCDSRSTTLRHGDLDLFAENFQHANDALLAAQGKPPKKRPADENSLGSHSESFHDV